MSKSPAYVIQIIAAIVIAAAIVIFIYPYLEIPPDGDMFKRTAAIASKVFSIMLAAALTVSNIYAFQIDKNNKDITQERIAGQEEIRRQQNIIQETQQELKEERSEIIELHKENLNAQMETKKMVEEVRKEFSETAKKLNEKIGELERDLGRLRSFDSRLTSVETLIKLQTNDVSKLKKLAKSG